MKLSEVLQVLSELQLTMDQFIDLCILLGCDYVGRIQGEPKDMRASMHAAVMAKHKGGDASCGNALSYLYIVFIR